MIGRLGKRVTKLEERYGIVDPEGGFFVVGRDEQADALREAFARAGNLEPACFVTGIDRDRPLWLPMEGEPGRDRALRDLTDTELDAMIELVQTAIAAAS